MSQLQVVSEEQFRELLGKRLGQHLNRAVAVLNNFRPQLSYDVTNVMLHAVDRGKEEEVLTILETHWKEHLQFQHPDIRGAVESVPGFNKTEQMFLQIFRQTLCFTLAATAA